MKKHKVMTVAGMQITAIPIKELGHMPTRNPNVMGPDRRELLEKTIREHGFLQPILVYFDNETDAWVIADGEHRVEALAKLGVAEVPAVVAPDAEAARVLRLAMNKLRGELDLSLVGLELLDLSGKLSLPELTATGFTAAEVGSMLEMARGTDEDDVLTGVNLDVEQDVKPKTYNLTFKFATESERARVKEALEAYGTTLEEALANLVRAGGV